MILGDLCDLFQQLKIHCAVQCKYCDGWTNCSCGTCHSDECNRLRQDDDNRRLRELFSIGASYEDNT